MEKTGNFNLEMKTEFVANRETWKRTLWIYKGCKRSHCLRRVELYLLQILNKRNLIPDRYL